MDTVKIIPIKKYNITNNSLLSLMQWFGGVNMHCYFIWMSKSILLPSSESSKLKI